MRAGLARLYPSAWRERYGDEFEAMLEEQRTTFSRLVDVVLGAIDARLTGNAAERRGWWIGRLPAMFIVLGSLVWLGAFIANHNLRDGDLINFAAYISYFGHALVTVGVFAQPWSAGGNATARWLRVLPGVALFVQVAFAIPTAWSLLGLPWLVNSGGLNVAVMALQRLSPAVLAVWATTLAARQGSGRIPLLALAANSLLITALGPFDYPAPSYALLLYAASPMCWLAIGLWWNPMPRRDSAGVGIER